MRYEKTGSQGAFTIWGSGLCYRYVPEHHALRITDTARHRAFANLTLDDHVKEDPLGYVRYLDRANQIKALMFSNDKTVRLADTVSAARLRCILKGTARTSLYAHNLKYLHFKEFATMFLQDSDLKAVRVRQFDAGAGSKAFFAARIQTQHDNVVSVRGCHMASVMAALSEKTQQDLMTMEYGQRFHNSAQGLLGISALLSSIGAVLDEEFVPSQRIKRYDIIPLPARHTEN